MEFVTKKLFNFMKTFRKTEVFCNTGEVETALIDFRKPKHNNKLAHFRCN